MNRLLFYFFIGFQYLAYYTPNFILKPLLDGIAWLLLKLNKKHYNIAKTNIDMVFGKTISEDEKENILKESFHQLVYNFADMLVTNIQSEQEILDKIEFINLEYIAKPLKDNKKLIVFGAHNSNWELIMTAPPLVVEYNIVAAVGRTISNPYLNEYLIRSRERFGLQAINPEGGGKDIIKVLRQPSSVVGFLVDQNITKQPCDTVQFAGKDVSVSSASAAIGMKMGAMFIPFWISSNGFGKYTIEFFSPLEYSDVTKESIHEMTQRQSDFVETMIRKNPAEWLWVHQKFKAFHRPIYNPNPQESTQ
jgi:Kdo2-lipid IVA lauroyltransferase/acyltransferase